MSKNKYYAVKKGLVPGIYNTWDECKEVVSGYPGAIYKSFTSIEDAENYMNANDSKPVPVPAKVPEALPTQGIVAYVDGSYDEGTKRYSCGVVILKDGKEYYLTASDNDPEMTSMRNVAGEIMGAQLAMKYAFDNGFKEITIVHDYQGISSWCLGEWKTNKKGTIAFKEFYNRMANAVNIKFQKVKGHTNVFYNELADSLAKKELGITIKKSMEEHIANNS